MKEDWKMREPTEMEMRVAQAIRKHLYVSGCQMDRCDPCVEDVEAATRAAIRAMLEATPEMLTPIALLIAPDDVPDGVAEHPRRVDQTAEAVMKTWTAVIDAASPPDLDGE